ncbi:hypothetical protein TMES_11050 [Thalassospira mesophila]|uniref:Uncharacterized protein n=1 Tax=Thalassospira mesophila TaxID=1293891 RepID=A0A1Y2KZY0_9PROT|nr:hypothetical protein TMES_11050 [Thalassospira mesophila]
MVFAFAALLAVCRGGLFIARPLQPAKAPEAPRFAHNIFYCPHDNINTAATRDGGPLKRTGCNFTTLYQAGKIQTAFLHAAQICASATKSHLQNAIMGAFDTNNAVPHTTSPARKTTKS